MNHSITQTLLPGAETQGKIKTHWCIKGNSMYLKGLELVMALHPQAQRVQWSRIGSRGSLLMVFETFLFVVLGLAALDLLLSRWQWVEMEPMAVLFDVSAAGSIASIASNVLMFGVAAVLWMIWWSEDAESESQRLVRHGWLFTAISFTCLAVVECQLTFSQVIALVNQQPDAMNLFEAGGHHLVFPLTVVVGFGVGAFLLSQTTRNLRSSYLSAGFLLLALIGLAGMIDRIPGVYQGLATASWSAADIRHFMASAEMLLKMTAMSILLITFLGYLSRQKTDDEGGRD